MSTVDLPKIQQPFLDQNGQISRPWWIWLQQLMTRIGGSNGTDLTAIRQAILDLIAENIEQANEINGAVQLPPAELGLTDEAVLMVYASPSAYVNAEEAAAAAPVQSVFARTGAVTAQSGDYTVGQVTNAASVLNPLSQFAATTSAQLAGVLSDETGSGAAVFGTSPTLTTPVIASIVNTGTLTLPTSTDTLVGRATTDTLTNKTLTSPTVNTPTVSGGTVNNAVIGGTTPAAGTFTTLAANSNVALFYKNSSGQSINNVTDTQITNWTLSYDRNSNFNPTTGIFTAPHDGDYLVCAQIMQSNAMAVGNTCSVNIRSGTTVLAQGFFTSQNAGTTNPVCNVQALIRVTAGSTLNISFLQGSGGSITLNTTATVNWLSITQIP